MNGTPLKALVMAGGTGGHVFPALAVATRLREMGHQIVWMGTRAGMESSLVPKHDFPIRYIDVVGLRGKGLTKLLSAPWVLMKALIQALRVVNSEKPNVVLGMGGFASGPGGLAAWLLRKPLVIHEQNAAAGVTNKILARFARRPLQAFSGALKGAEVVGNPVREAFFSIPQPAARMKSGSRKLLVVGGSLGAQALNQKVAEAVALLDESERPEIWHQGGRTVSVAEASYRANKVKARVETFIDDMAAAYAWADLIVCRSGAMTVAELAASGCASILVPFPYATDDHQTANAKSLVSSGAAVLIDESDLTAQVLADAITALFSDPKKLLGMAEAAHGCAIRDSRERIVKVCIEEARS